MESNTDKAGLRVRAVLALLRGQPAAEVSAEMGICRSDLYKFRKRVVQRLSRDEEQRLINQAYKEKGYRNMSAIGMRFEAITHSAARRP